MSLVPVFVILVIVAVDLWVYVDAKRCMDAGTPVVLRIGTVVVDTPAAWFAGCLVLGVVFLPLYMVSRTR